MTVSHEIFPSLLPIADKYKGILLDAYGVFWGSNDYGLLPGSQAIMEKLVLDGKIVGILSNTTQLASKEIHKLHQHGLVQGKHFHFFVSSGEVAREIFLNEKLPFETPNHKFWLFCGAHPKFPSHVAIFKESRYSEASAIDEADFIYVSVPHIKGVDQVDAELFRKEVEAIRPKNLPLVCPNPDQFAHEGKPPKAVVRQGSIARMYEEMGGKVFYIGKPYPQAYSIALERFREHKITALSEILMVGDTPETDIRGARRLGISSALITETGIMADRISHRGLEKALGELPSDAIPNYLIARFADGLHTSS